MAAANIVTITDQNFEAEVLNSSTPVLVDFWATWCGPCKAVAPTLDQLAGEYDGRVKIAKLDIDHNPKTTSKFGIQAVPTFIMFKGGAETGKMLGAKTKRDFVAMIDKSL